MSLIKLEYFDVNDKTNPKKTLEFSKKLLTNIYNEKSLFVIQVDGKSMQPVINDKALVVADLSQKEIINDSIYLVYKDDKMWIKKAKKENENITFISINKDFSHLIYKQKDVRVIAKAILTFTNL